MPQPGSQGFVNSLRAKNSVKSDFIKTEVTDLLTKLGETLGDVYSLSLELDLARDEETDPELRANMGEYAQKLGGLEREVRRLREKVEMVKGIMKELAEFDAYLGDQILGG